MKWNDIDERKNESERTLRVTVGEAERLEREAIERIRAAERGADLDDAQPVLDFDSYESLTHFFRESNLDLLETIVREEPASISETARLVDRDYREVHRNLSELESLGLIEFDGEGAGKSKRPIFPYDAIDVSLTFAEDEPESDPITLDAE